MKQILHLGKPKSGFAKATERVGSGVAVLSKEAERLKHNVTDAMHDAARQTQHAAHKTYDQANEWIEEGGACIKRNPYSAVAVAFGAGIAIGFALIRAFKR